MSLGPHYQPDSGLFPVRFCMTNLGRTTQPSTPRTFCILGASFETNNLGVNALASGAIAGILDADPQAQVVIGDYSRGEISQRVRLLAGNSREVPMLAFRFSWRFWLPNNIFRLLVVTFLLRLLPSTLRESRIQKNRCLRILRSTQLVFAVNGGDSFSDIYGLRRLLYVLFPQFLVLQLGRPLVLLPQTYGPFHRAGARWLARSILCRARSIAARDYDGDREVGNVTRGVRRAEFTHDMAFLMPVASPVAQVVSTIESLKSQGDLIGLNISGLLWIGGYTRNNSFGVRGDYREMVRQVAAHLVGKFNARILLVPHVYGVNGESDVYAIQQFLAQAPKALRTRLAFIDTRLDQNEVKWLIGQCDFFIGSRMHACIAALSQALPAVGLAYSGKFSGVFKTIAVEELALDLRAMDVPTVVDAVDQAYRSRVDFRAKLDEQIPRARDSLSAFFSKIMADG